MKKVIIADDSLSYRSLLERMLRQWNYETTVVEDGKEAWNKIQQTEPPFILMLDWMMPEMEGVEVCERIREHYPGQPIYTILLTARSDEADIAHGLYAGADEYIVKPFKPIELKSRLHAGERILDLQIKLSEKVDSLEDAITKIKVLHGLLPICSYCKKIRDDDQYWHEVDEYVAKHTDTQFSHSICPICLDLHFKEPPESE